MSTGLSVVSDLCVRIPTLLFVGHCLDLSTEILVYCLQGSKAMCLHPADTATECWRLSPDDSLSLGLSPEGRGHLGRNVYWRFSLLHAWNENSSKGISLQIRFVDWTLVYKSHVRQVYSSVSTLRRHLQWLQALGSPGQGLTCSLVARKGRIRFEEWLRDRMNADILYVCRHSSSVFQLNSPLTQVRVWYGMKLGLPLR